MLPRLPLVQIQQLDADERENNSSANCGGENNNSEEVVVEQEELVQSVRNTSIEESKTPKWNKLSTHSSAKSSMNQTFTFIYA